MSEAEIADIKNELLDNLWISIAIEAGRTFCPHLRKNKKMKVLTLTNHTNFREVVEFVKNRLTKKELIVGWNRARVNGLRLDSEGKVGTVFPGTAYEDSIALGTHDIVNEFPFDIVNLDFCSQGPETTGGRIEKELHSVENTIRLQVQNGKRNMALIYTTLFDSRDLSLLSIKRDSDRIRMNGWDRLHITGIPNTVSRRNQKAECVKKALEQYLIKYNCKGVNGLRTLEKRLSRRSEFVFSVGMILSEAV